MKVTIGTGYVGFVRGACLAEVGNQAPCLDLDLGKIRSLDNGDISIHEPDLLEMVLRNVAAGRLNNEPAPFMRTTSFILKTPMADYCENGLIKCQSSH